MEITVSKQAIQEINAQCLILPVYAGGRTMAPETEACNEASGGAIDGFMKRGDLSGEPGSRAMLYDLPGIKSPRVLLIGCGAPGSMSLTQWRKMLDTAVAAAGEANARSVAVALTSVALENADTDLRLQHLAQAFGLANYRFTAFKSKQPKRTDITRVSLMVGAHDALPAAKRAAATGAAIAAGMRYTRDLANRPANECTPSYLASSARGLVKGRSRLSVKVLSEAEMKKLGMGALLSVSAGSAQPAKLIVLEYKGGAKNKRPVALVGKGVTFDTGGISIKPAANMAEMKYDMAGAASVLGTMLAIDDMALNANVVGLIPATENMPSGTATKPGDVVTSMSGQTIEILNTDAEGRLILSDALTYAERYNPTAVVDIATLTGACIVALGHHASGLMANDDELAEHLISSGNKSGDRAWRLPLWDDYQSQIDSNVADFANLGVQGAGSITAACFLSRFAKSFKWAHLDIAGSAWNPGQNKAATGRPVPLLVQYLIDHAG